MHDIGRIVVVTLAVLIAVALLTLTIVYSVVPEASTVGPDQPIQNPNLSLPSGINQSYANSETGDLKLAQDKPFVVNTRRRAPTRSALLFSDIQFIPVTTPRSTGFAFYVTEEQIVVALQAIDQYFLDGQRLVGIFAVGSRSLLVSANISKSTDALVDGFRTRTLLFNEQVRLQPNTLYACIGQVKPGDYQTLENKNTGLFTSAVVFSATGSVNSSVFTLPTSFNGSTVTSPFPGFQLQRAKNDEFVPTFIVDQQTFSMPPNYIADCNVSVLEDQKTVRVTPGICASFATVSNLILSSPYTLTAPSEMQLRTWYAVYLVRSLYGSTDTNVILSQNYPEPFPYTSPNVIYRRIGFVQTHSLDPTRLVVMTQNGPETRRMYRLSFPIPHVFPDVNNAQLITVPLHEVSPTCILCTLQVTLEFAINDRPLPVVELALGTTQFVMFRANQSYQVTQVTVPLTSEFIPHVIGILCAYDPTVSVQKPKITVEVLDFTEDI